MRLPIASAALLKSTVDAFAGDYGRVPSADLILRSAILLAGDVLGWEWVARRLSHYQDEIAAMYGAGLTPPRRLRGRGSDGGGSAA